MPFFPNCFFKENRLLIIIIMMMIIIIIIITIMNNNNNNNNNKFSIETKGAELEKREPNQPPHHTPRKEEQSFAPSFFRACNLFIL